MPLLELYAVVVGVATKLAVLKHSPQEEGVRLIHAVTDCQPVWLASVKGRAPRFRNRAATRMAARLWQLALKLTDRANAALVLLWVPRDRLVHADALSRGLTLQRLREHPPFTP